VVHLWHRLIFQYDSRMNFKKETRKAIFFNGLHVSPDTRMFFLICLILFGLYVYCKEPVIPKSRRRREPPIFNIQKQFDRFICFNFVWHENTIDRFFYFFLRFSGINFFFPKLAEKLLKSQAVHGGLHFKASVIAQFSMEVTTICLWSSVDVTSPLRKLVPLSLGPIEPGPSVFNTISCVFVSPLLV
jgi:hypothetical protein